MEIEYSFENNGIHINFKTSITEDRPKIKIHNALKLLQKEAGVPEVKIIYEESAVD